MIYPLGLDKVLTKQLIGLWGYEIPGNLKPSQVQPAIAMRVSPYGNEESLNISDWNCRSHHGYLWLFGVLDVLGTCHVVDYPEILGAL